MKANEIYISQIYLIKYSTCFRHFHCPSSGVSQHCIHAIGICHASTVDYLLADANITSMTIPTACIQCWDTPDDGQWTCPKHAEFIK
jgi:hypothetical protein